MAHFIFDREQFRYRKERKNILYYAAHMLPYVLLSTAIGALMVLGYYLLFDTSETLRLKQDRRLLVQTLQDLDSAQALLAQQVDSLRREDRKVYQMILNADPQEEPDSSQPENARVDAAQLRSLEDRIAQLQARLGNAETEATLRMLAGRSPAELASIPAMRPVTGEVISGYGLRRHPLKQTDALHSGIDLQADAGTPVRATGHATVLETGTRPNGQGLYIALQHAQGYVSRYAHLSQILVVPGQRVQRGAVIGRSGSSGICKGNHLHYEIWKNGSPVDPIDYFFTEVSPDQFIQLKEKASRKNESMD